MRKNLLLIAALFSCSFFTNAQSWVDQNTNFPIESTGLNHISTPSIDVAWVLGYDGSGGGANFIDFSRTTDGGATWIPGTVGTDTNAVAFANICALDGSTAWVAAFNNATQAQGGVWKTTDGGTSWNQQDPTMFQGDSSFADFVYFWNADTGVVVGDPEGGRFEIYTSVDGGANWIQVPVANIPVHQSGEFGIVDYFDVYGGTIWFATNKGRVYKSVDRGHNWTVSTVIALPSTQAMEVKFLDDNVGLAQITNATTGAFVSQKRSLDGGATWSVLTKTGTFFTSTFGRIPTTSIFMSTGAAAGWSGSSYSLDSGRTWTTIDTTVQHTAFGAFDPNNIWSGSFVNGGTGGIFKLSVVPCGAPGLTPGVSTTIDSTICFGDTLVISNIGSSAPFELNGRTYGFSVIVSTADISGNNDPLSDLSVIGGTGVIAGTPGPTVLIHNEAIFPAGEYYFTPVVYGNATGSGNITALTLDPSCTYTGTSLHVILLANGDPSCAVGIPEIASADFSVHAFLGTSDNIHVKINSNVSDKAIINVYDVAGRIVAGSTRSIVKGENNELLDASTLGAGTYFISVQTGTAKAVAKIVKL